MSSLMQFRGTCSRRGVDLQFTLCREVAKTVGNPDLPVGHPERGYTYPTKEDLDTFTDPATGRQLPHIYIATRKPVGMLGCWVQFRYNGAVHAPDLSIPIRVTKIPRGARRLSVEASLRIWKS